MNPALNASGHTGWETPAAFFDRLDREFVFTLDACADENNRKVPLYFSEAENALEQEWRGRVWCNPPYGYGIKHWLAKAHLEACINAEVVVCLVPARTDTRWWHEHVMHADEVRLVMGRITFVGATDPAPFPCAVVVFRAARQNASGPVFSSMGATQ